MAGALWANECAEERWVSINSLGLAQQAPHHAGEFGFRLLPTVLLHNHTLLLYRVEQRGAQCGNDMAGAARRRRLLVVALKLVGADSACVDLAALVRAALLLGLLVAEVLPPHLAAARRETKLCVGTGSGGHY